MTRVSNEHLILLGTMSDKDLSAMAGVTRERIRQLRTQKNIPKYSKDDNKEKILLKYIENKNNEIISLTELELSTGIYYINSHRITIERVKELCNRNNIKVLFGVDTKITFQHSYYGYKRGGCRCEICVLANSLFTYSYRRFRKNNYQFLNKFANEHLNLYKTNKKEFHEKYKKEFSLFLKNLKNI